jgi:propanol-preferring alcohol dehydrogenase
LRKGGTLAVVGMPNEPFKVSAVALVSGETRIVASAVGTREDLREMFELVAKFPIRCHVETRPLEALPAVFDEMKRGTVLGRVVLVL